MFNRKPQSSHGKDIPQEWKENFIQALQEAFSQKLLSEHHIFDAFGKIYADEMVVACCLYNSKNLGEVPISCFISLDLDDKIKKDPTKALNNMMDLTGLFFEEYFAEEYFTDHEPNWQETNFKKTTYYFKVTRENIPLTLEANKLLDEDYKKN